MNGGSCCSSPSRKPGYATGIFETAGWALPSALLVLMPKCPACIAGYIALATGVGISFAAATYLRTGLIVVSAGALMVFAVRQAFRFIRWKRVAR